MTTTLTSRNEDLLIGHELDKLSVRMIGTNWRLADHIEDLGLDLRPYTAALEQLTEKSRQLYGVDYTALEGMLPVTACLKVTAAWFRDEPETEAVWRRIAFRDSSGRRNK